VKRLLAIAFLSMILVVPARSQSRQERRTSGFDKEHTEWVAGALRSIQTIRVGMTRSELMKVFTTEGGLEFKDASTSRRTYVYRTCPYIKVDAKLAISNLNENLPTDKIYRNIAPLS